MGTTALLATLVAASGLGATIPVEDRQHQEQAFQQCWGTDFVWKFGDLPTQGGVPRERVPYSGYIYPDTAGGTAQALLKYDRAFHRGRSLAASYEQWDTTAFKEAVPVRGIFGMSWGSRMRTPGWYGHCNGWAAAAIRHAEPQRSVRVNGVVFSPADIKGLLAELYIYNDTLDLSGSAETISAPLFHAVVANWMGRGSHPLGLESDPGREKWNYPAYAFNTSSAQRSERTVEVKMNMAYAKDSNGEYTRSPRINRVKYFHYTLTLDAEGRIVGGAFFEDSARVDMLWVPLQPQPARSPGNERGNPHLDAEQVLAIWRQSVPEESRKNWFVVDAAPDDRLAEVAGVETLIPVGFSREQEHDPALAADPPSSDEGEAPADEASETGAPAEEAVADALAEERQEEHEEPQVENIAPVEGEPTEGSDEADATTDTTGVAREACEVSPPARRGPAARSHDEPVAVESRAPARAPHWPPVVWEVP